MYTGNFFRAIKLSNTVACNILCFSSNFCCLSNSKIAWATKKLPENVLCCSSNRLYPTPITENFLVSKVIGRSLIGYMVMEMYGNCTKLHDLLNTFQWRSRLALWSSRGKVLLNFIAQYTVILLITYFFNNNCTLVQWCCSTQIYRVTVLLNCVEQNNCQSTRAVREVEMLIVNTNKYILNDAFKAL